MSKKQKRVPFELMGYLKNMKSKAKIGNLIVEETKKQSSLEVVRISGILSTAREYHVADESISKYLDRYIKRESLDTLKKEIVFDEETKTNIIETIKAMEYVGKRLTETDIIKYVILFYCREWNI